MREISDGREPVTGAKVAKGEKRRGSSPTKMTFALLSADVFGRLTGVTKALPAVGCDGPFVKVASAGVRRALRAGSVRAPDRRGSG